MVMVKYWLWLVGRGHATLLTLSMEHCHGVNITNVTSYYIIRNMLPH